jgi:hypothetical protein
MTNYRFYRGIQGVDYGLRLGTAVECEGGWRFISNVASHKNSRKMHETMEQCLPRWVGYPDRCYSEAVVPNALPALERLR